MIEWRERYARLGFATIPLRPRGKRPLRKGWQRGGAEQWASAPADANIGVLTGASSGGLVVLDFDTRDGPERVLGMTPTQLAVLTIVVETARGWHVYAREPGRASSTPVEGLDVRGEGGMVVAPPSIHPSGVVYRLAGAAREVVPLTALVDDLHAPELLASPELTEAARVVERQAPKLREHWGRLRAPLSLSFDAWRADFAIACCLAEAGFEVERIADVLCALPGSRARTDGRAYALRTAGRATTRERRGVGRHPSAPRVE